MHEDLSVLSAWSNFYVITGSSAAALTGLTFIVITLIAGQHMHSSTDGIGTFSSPTVVHFCAALFVSAVLTAPWRSLVQTSVILGLTGAFGLAYLLRIAMRMLRLTQRENPDYRLQLDDWLRYVSVPFAAYATIILAAFWLPVSPIGALFAFGGSTVLLIFLGIHNAWDVVTFLAVSSIEEQNDDKAGDRSERDSVGVGGNSRDEHRGF
jgi:hypothetical protein